MEKYYKTITHPDGSRLAFFSFEGTEPGIMFFSGYKSDMNGTKACSIIRKKKISLSQSLIISDMENQMENSKMALSQGG